MLKLLIPSLAGVAAVAAAAPATAQPYAAPPSAAYHRTPLERALTARLQSIQLRIQLLRQEGLMGSEEARDLGEQSRSLERRLIGLTARDASDVELGIARLNDRVRLASDDARWRSDPFEAPDQQIVDRDPYETNAHGNFHVDRHVAPPVDRWEDPFDRGDRY